MRITCEIMNYRAGQKLDIIRKTFGESLKSPKELFTEAPLCLHERGLSVYSFIR